jgi:hypothetical protein
MKLGQHGCAPLRELHRVVRWRRRILARRKLCAARRAQQVHEALQLCARFLRLFLSAREVRMLAFERVR